MRITCKKMLHGKNQSLHIWMNFCTMKMGGGAIPIQNSILGKGKGASHRDSLSPGKIFQTILTVCQKPSQWWVNDTWDTLTRTAWMCISWTLFFKLLSHLKTPKTNLEFYRISLPVFSIWPHLINLLSTFIILLKI